jgi:hypothetical protein
VLSGDANTNEGSSYTLNIVGSDPAGVNDTLSYSIDWGDGSAVENLTAAQLAALNGNVTHKFADDSDAPGDNATAHTIAVTVNDGDGGSTVENQVVTVHNVAPTIALSGASHVNEDAVYTLNLGAITDPGTDTVTSYLVNWGDGTSNTYSNAGDVTHTYADGPAHRTITVDLTDEDGQFANAGLLDVDVYGVVKLGDAPVSLNSSNPNGWINAWTKPGIDIQHKADYTNESWSAITKNALGSSVLAGGDLFAGDLGVSGQNAATSVVKQEIDGREALRFTLPDDDLACEVSINLSRFYQHDDGSQVYSESGRLQAFNGDTLVGELNFTADSANGLKTIALHVDEGFDSLVLTAGDYNGGDFVFGAYAKDDGSFGSNPYTTGTTQHGSDFLVDVVLIGVQPEHHG